MRRRIYTALGLVVILLLTGCTVSVSPRYGNLRGFVGVRRNLALESQGALSGQISPEDVVISSSALDYDLFFPLEGVTVRISGENRKWTTDSDGMFYAYELRVGLKTVTISDPALREDLVVRNVEVREGNNNMKPPAIGGAGYYLIIGIDKYNDSLLDATGAENDAKRVFNVFNNHTSLARYTPELLLGQDADRDGIERAINKFTLSKNSQDHLVVYFTGHMGWDFFSPWDDTRRYDNSITDTELELWLREFPGDVTVILDGYSSAAFANGEMRPLALKRPEYTVITSAKEGQNAHVFAETGEGLFTHFLVEGLTPQGGIYPADTEWPYGTITAQEIFDYIQLEMADYLKEINENLEPGDQYLQEPELYVGSSVDSTVILRY